MRIRRFTLLAAAAAVLALALPGCSSSTSPAPSTSSTAPTSSAAPSESTAVLPPVIVTEDQSEATAKVGDAIVFNVDDPAAWKIATSDPSILEVSQGGPEGSAVFNPGAVALAAGMATVTLTPDVGEPRIVIVTVDAV